MRKLAFFSISAGGRNTSDSRSSGDRRHGHLGNRRPPAFLWVPAAVVLALLAVPLVYLVLRATEAGNETWDVVLRRRTFDIFRNTAILAVGVGAATVAVAVPFAWLTSRTDLPGRRLWATAAIMPLIIPSYVGALTVVSALGPRGLIQQGLEPFGVERLPEIYGFWGAWLTLTLFTYPYVFLSVRAALRGLDPALEEASRGLGHGPWRSFFTCVLPQLRPAIATGALLSALYTVGDFGVVTLLRYDAFTRAIYVQYRSSFNRSQAAALALLLVGFALVLLLAEGWMRGRRAVAYHRIGAGAARRARVMPLGRWRGVALTYCALVVGAGVGMPLVVLVYWLIKGVSRGDDANELLPAIVGSLSVSAMAALAATAAALPVAILAARYRGRIGSLVERASYLGYALPGVVIALAFVFLGARYLTPIYQTMTLLVIAYVVRFLPQAVGGARLSLLQINPRLEDAARNLGRSPFGAIVAVTAPLARPGILAGTALVFLTVMKELPLTLFLRPTGFETLATNLWTATTGGAYAKAAAPALLLILASAIPTLFLEGRGKHDGNRSEG